MLRMHRNRAISWTYIQNAPRLRLAMCHARVEDDLILSSLDSLTCSVSAPIES